MDEMLALYTQAFFLWVMGVILFPTRSKNTVSVKYLPLLSNLQEVGDYAWGAATLAYLYRALHKATRLDSKAICACLSLLQSEGQPLPEERRSPSQHYILSGGARLAISGPDALGTVQTFGARVGESFIFTLSGLQRTPLIHLEVAEWQLTDRAMRHFDCLQGLPADAPDMRVNRNPSSVGWFGKANAHDLCAREIEVWNSWQDTLAAIVSEPDPVISIEQYNEWYYRITRKRVDPVRFEHQEKYHPRGQIDEHMAYDLVNASPSSRN
ncbi:hypothetical protein RJ639_012780 [Escallonia herrerae]|uniref:Aminotransferase-like plant mobile domain-containing protein n=1 Tax=Escallonia herrerae TaxID=1293975 RepID=A0AA88VK44_9ASTE|nr:hypothetical protein RJ639_012780 [Escallonia herrerae]